VFARTATRPGRRVGGLDRWEDLERGLRAYEAQTLWGRGQALAWLASVPYGGAMSSRSRNEPDATHGLDNSSLGPTALASDLHRVRFRVYTMSPSGSARGARRPRGGRRGQLGLDRLP